LAGQLKNTIGKMIKFIWLVTDSSLKAKDSTVFVARPTHDPT